MHGIARQHRTAPRGSVLRSVTQALEMMSGIYCITVQGSLIFRCVTPQNLTTVGQRRMHHQKRGRATIEWRGVCGSALKLHAVWEGDRRETKGRTGLGKAHCPGSQGGLWKRAPWWN